jgi:putative DNA primase/helicase
VATQTGWHKGAYILPESCIGSDDYFYQSENVHTDVPYRQAGTLAEWQHHIARYCVGNPLLMLSACCAFTGALLKPAHQQGGGFHFSGESSKGKTTGLEVACSVHGDGSYKRTWKATGNGMEATAAMFNDGFLALDEIGECDPKEVGNIIYQIANGVGKSRANKSGGAKASYQWRVMVLSNGEVSVESAMQEAGKRVKAGQLMRLLNIPIFGKYGAFNELHDMQDGRALADHLKTASLKYYGVAGIDYLTKVVAETRNIDELAARYTQALIGDEILSSQEGRAAKYFALVAFAGELATEYGITGWNKGDACAGVKECFKQWRKSFGGGDTEDRQIKEAVRAYVEMYGDARFTDTKGDTRLHSVRSGYWKDGANGREWLFSKSGLMEAVKGYDLKKAVDVLKKCGWLMLDGQGKSKKPLRLNSGVERFYFISFVAGADVEKKL